MNNALKQMLVCWIIFVVANTLIYYQDFAGVQQADLLWLQVPLVLDPAPGHLVTTSGVTHDHTRHTLCYQLLHLRHAGSVLYINMFICMAGTATLVSFTVKGKII